MNNWDRVSHDCEKCWHKRVCQSQDACNLIDYCGNYAEKPRFKPGDAVWIVLRGERGNALDVIDYMFLAKSEGVVIVEDNIFLDRLDVVIKKLVQRTKQRLRTGLCVYPAADCYATRKEAWAAVDKEDEGK